MRPPQFAEVKLGPSYRGLNEALLFDVESDGGYDVETRFCDLYGDGQMRLCELRLRLHYHDEEEDGDEEDDAG